MPQLRHHSHGTYRVHYAPDAWREVGRMPAETFLALQQVLERLGDATGRAPDVLSGPAMHVLPQHGLELSYTWDERSRTLTLLSLQRVPREP
ncbi:hypothetical protein [Pyxidicoccus xibeiensis]|uniref:hypothetical protein n=1 Tax=Pyxidicoccus xibeiensis TaxID=2906759 RepID=UPI0020A70188|nr:hypothetical protein [Pyxidicoccus xibeiensis]MCP3137145.1 hypothetical protein [Pyxidicoccus xibeiensis]